MNVSELIDSKSGERKYLNAEERKAFFEATTFMDNDIKFYGRMIYYTGARLSEVLAVTPDFIDYKERVVIIKTLKQNPDRPYLRPIELPADYLESLNDVYGVKKKQGSDAGQKRIWNFTDRTAQKYIKAIMNTAGITGKKSTSRGLRHSMGVLLVQNKVPLNIVQKILGHRDIKNTMIYAEALEKERREMISRVW